MGNAPAPANDRYSRADQVATTTQVTRRDPAPIVPSPRMVKKRIIRRSAIQSKQRRAKHIRLSSKDSGTVKVNDLLEPPLVDEQKRASVERSRKSSKSKSPRKDPASQSPRRVIDRNLFAYFLPAR